MVDHHLRLSPYRGPYSVAHYGCKIAKLAKMGKVWINDRKTHYIPILFLSVNSKKWSSYHAIVPSTLVKLHLLSQKPRLVFIQQSLRKTPLWVGMPGPMFLLGGTIGGQVYQMGGGGYVQGVGIP